MAVIDGTIDNVQLVQGPSTGAGDRKTYEISCSFAAVTAGDTIRLVSVDTAIETSRKSGKTFTLRQGATGNPGSDTADVATYFGLVITNTSGTLAATLGTEPGVTAIRAACSGVKMYIVGVDS